MTARVTPLAAACLVVAALGFAALASVGARRGPGATARAEAAALGRDGGASDAPSESAAARALREGRRLDLNTSTATDLQLLPGIGPKLSERIARARGEGGAFEAVEELRRVRGIGPKTLERLRPLIRVGPRPDGGPGGAGAGR